MNKLATNLNRDLGEAAAFLSSEGKRLYFPYGGILGQGAEAKGCAINATIGMAFEEDGSPLVMKCFGDNLKLDKKAFLYAGSFGLPKLREQWSAMELKKNPSLKGVKFSNPVVTNALTHGLRIAAEMFADKSDTLVVPDLYWDNYELIFQEAVGCKVAHFNTFKKGAFDAAAMKAELLKPGKKKLLILNFPNNPTGYTATIADAKKIVAAVKQAAKAGKKIVVILDDAYFGLVYERGIHEESLFAEFAKLDPNVLAVKLDGTTKEDYVWGLRVGFIAFAFKGAKPEQLKALEAKAAGNVRSCISNASSLGQHLAIAAYADAKYWQQKQEKYNVLKARYLEIRRVLKAHPEYLKSFEVMPFNSGYFMCVKPIGVEAEKVRKVLIEKYSTGTIVLSGLIRLAFSTIPKDKLAKLFENVHQAIAGFGMIGRHFIFAVAAVVSFAASADWPMLKTYEGAALSKVKLPIGGIGTGTISLSGRGSLVDWELDNHPAKGYTPRHSNYAPHFALRCETVDGRKVGRLLEGPLFDYELEGAEGCPVQNQGFPRFEKAVFKTAYPLATIELTDAKIPLEVKLEAFNPLVKGDSSSSGIPAAYFRWRLRNPTANAIKASICGTLVIKTTNDLVLVAGQCDGKVTRVDGMREPGWNVGLDRYWRHFVSAGEVVASPANEPKGVPVVQRCVAVEIAAGEEKTIPFVIAWRNDGRKGWCQEVVGNFYCTEYATAQAAADRLLRDIDVLEAKTVEFVNGVLAKEAPTVIKEAALFNVSTLRSETCFRTRDGHFFGWEGCRDDRGSCHGSCTHVWGYEHCLVDIWPNLARDMLDTQFGAALAKNGGMNFRVNLPYDKNNGWLGIAAADGQMQCIIKAYEYFSKSGDEAWLKRTWANIRKSLEFAWIKGGWDGDQDGVMEGCQHNTMDVEYYGPNPQMEFLYLAALQAGARMAERCGEGDFAAKCRDLRAKGSKWTEENLFNGEYYIHKIVPPKGVIAQGLRHPSMGARDLSNPDYQLGEGCLVDQLVGDFAARTAGLEPVADFEHAKKTVATILKRNRKAPDDDQLNNMRGYAMVGEESLRMAWYPEGRMPRSPFPYYIETMTGFEYVVAALQVYYGDREGAVRTVKNIRDRYDGVKRNPFDEAECGHHYARALDAWTVLQAW